MTKSGTNKVHGSLYVYNRPTFTTANDWFNKASQLQADEANTPPFLLRNTFGANVGGPIIKDRLFFFAAYEGQRKREDLQVTRVVPSLGLRTGSISYPCDVTDTVNCIASNPKVQNVGGTLIATLNANDIAGMDPNCSSIGSCPLGPGANPLIAYLQGNPNSKPELHLQSVPPAQYNYGWRSTWFQEGFTFPSPLPASLDDYVLKFDYNLTRDGNHRLFLKGIMDNERSAQRNFVNSPNTVTGDGGEEFPRATRRASRAR